MFTLLALGAVTALGLSGCSAATPAPLRSASGDKTPSSNNIGGSFGFSPARDAPVSVVVGDYVCVTSKPVIVTNVSLHHPSPGFVVRRWGIDNGHNDLGEADGSLKQLGPFTSHKVTLRCGHNRTFAEIGVELARTAPHGVAAQGFDVHYRDGSHIKVRWLDQAASLDVPRSTKHKTDS